MRKGISYICSDDLLSYFMFQCSFSETFLQHTMHIKHGFVIVRVLIDVFFGLLLASTARNLCHPSV